AQELCERLPDVLAKESQASQFAQAQLDRIRPELAKLRDKATLEEVRRVVDDSLRKNRHADAAHAVVSRNLPQPAQDELLTIVGNRWLSEADRVFEKGEYAAAYPEYEAILKEFPEGSQVRYACQSQMGRILDPKLKAQVEQDKSAGKFEEALASLEN